MIGPLSGLRILDERPIRAKRLTKRFREWLKLSQSKTDGQLETELQALMDRVSKCKDRSEIADILGPPDYAISGKSFGSQSINGETLHPDIVE